MVKKVKKRRLNLKRTLILILFLYILWYSFNYLVKSPIKHIEISGNNLVLDNDIIISAKLADYPAIMKYTSNTIEKNIKSLNLVEDVIVKKKFGNIVNIEIKEKKLMFYYLDNKKIVLSDGSIVDNNFDDVYGKPVLISSVDKDILNRFVLDFVKLNDEIIYEINEIEYFPKFNQDNEIINDLRFKISMNDGNLVIVNINTINILNKYNDIYASLNDVKGTIDLDSSSVDSLVFIPFEE